MERVREIRKSTRKDKKYMAITNRGRTIHFGQRGYQQYKDSTPLKLYSAQDHMDPKRRQRYFERFSGVKTKAEALRKESKITAKFLSHKYLW